MAHLKKNFKNMREREREHGERRVFLSFQKKLWNCWMKITVKIMYA
jgi:hypothetical protein